MKFLIFNIIVFCSLGYLLTSQPNENFSEWAGNTKDKLSQISKKEVIETIKKASGKKKQIINVLGFSLAANIQNRKTERRRKFRGFSHVKSYFGAATTTHTGKNWRAVATEIGAKIGLEIG